MDKEIKVGDRITYRYLNEEIKSEFISIISEKVELENYKKMVETKDKINSIEILKVERPKYEVVEEKKEILTEKEKEFLKQVFKIANYGKDNGNGEILFIKKFGYFLYFHYDEWGCNTLYFDKNIYFKKLEEDVQYSLKDLGLKD